MSKMAVFEIDGRAVILRTYYGENTCSEIETIGSTDDELPALLVRAFHAGRRAKAFEIKEALE